MLAMKILCLGFVRSPLDSASRVRLLGAHALAMTKTLSKHLAQGYRLISMEEQGTGFRLDLLLRDPTGKVRLIEIKSGRTIRESHRLQAAIYGLVRSDLDEIVVSNGVVDEKLGPEYLAQAVQRARRTIELLETDPIAAASSYSPHPDTCYICGNTRCPYFSMTAHSSQISLQS